MTDFVLYQDKKQDLVEDFYSFVMDYAEFLKQPLTLGMFVPCNLKGEPMESPYLSGVFHSHYRLPVKFSNFTDEFVKEYEEAKEKVLFEGFHLKSENIVVNDSLGLTIYLDTYQFALEGSLGISGGDLFGKTLEHLDLELPLTPSALKQIYG